MIDQIQPDIEDIADASNNGRPVRPHGPWRIQIGDEKLDYRSAPIDDPVPTGLQILELVDAGPPEEFMVFQVLRGGALEEIRPTETTDLRASEVERFLVFKGSASYRINLDGQVLEWGKPVISGLVLKKLARVDPAKYGVWLEVREGDDKPIGDSELIDLTPEGLERFFTGIVQTTAG